MCHKTVQIKILFIGLLAVACRQPNMLIQSPERLADIQRMLAEQKKLTANCMTPLWEIFDSRLSRDENQAMEFLYAYMPLSDLADYSPGFFLANVRKSLDARSEMPWGSIIPEDEFLHFVLPLRVNNENLDSFRLVMYNEIRDRIKGMDMAHAALEINHWCHEKVSYRPTDLRTSAPLSTVKKAFGRCGEESTFTVAAMRTAGIPARQVYTPRWAHTDDNHAWVEVWINGKWHYLGACEPEPILDMGWFSEPSKRAMLIHTRAYGKYFGQEEVITREDRFSELNLTSRYAPVKTIAVVVRDRRGSLARHATVDFGLYNYAEFYPIATKQTNDSGTATLTTGLGDLLVWASDGTCFDYKMISVAATDTLSLTLGTSKSVPHVESYDLVPPHTTRITIQAGDREIQENNLRLAMEDSIRMAYMATFRDSAWSASFAGRLGLNRDSVAVVMGKSYGNWPEIAAFLEENKDAGHTALALLYQLSDKDLSDARATTLTDHLVNSAGTSGKKREIFERWILSPRIANENLSPWRGFLKSKMAPLAGPASRDISVLTAWIRDSITVNIAANLHSRAPLTPAGVYNLRAADPQSRDIFFVAVCRAMEIPARLNPVTMNPEYKAGGVWQRVNLDVPESPHPMGSISLINKNGAFMPRYYTHFTLARLKQGFYRTLAFNEGMKLMDFQSPMEVDTGQYMLVTGNRLEDGAVLSTITFFHVKPGERDLPVVIRLLPGKAKPSGKLNLNGLMFTRYGSEVPQPLAALATSNMVIFLLDPEKEPSQHVLNEISAYEDHFSRRQEVMVFGISGKQLSDNEWLSHYDLPPRKIMGEDTRDNILDALEDQYGELSGKLPVVVLCDREGNIYLFSAGYTIGIAEQLLKFRW
jgi:hypothetical protein